MYARRRCGHTGKVVLRDYINATMGFDALGSESLRHMFGPNGNPPARNLFEVINHIQQYEGVRLEGQVAR